jgi:hypothetical protein
MALDTATKRGAAIQTGMAPGVVLPVPDGTIDAQDRADLAGVVTPSASGGSDSTPDAFSFVDQTGVAKSSVITSDPITVSGIDTSSAITVTGGSYSINGAAFTTSAGTVVLGDQVRAQHVSSASNATATNTAVTIGGVSDTFTSTTDSSATGGGVAPFFRRRRRH